ncbi:hypothetical protein Lal_00032693 [Lupinus albus]|uniref:Putative transcription factor MYB-HB-like family n=1 Tax=Lupinus albus TaxID=3870 RepID=A0A6A5PNF4_LUPAL|nr:putative transcription factor MYB-HB-like family [Lupinus albus]KAF1897931.1 hypothetical protein Lal_00032693 [Lupinus albus]
MGRAPCCDKANVKKGPWSLEEDAKLRDYIEIHGTGGNWIALPQKVGLKRCGKSCRLRWLNYLRPNIKHGEFSEAEERVICSIFANIGSRWSIIASQLPGRTDNDIKNYWNTKLKKKMMIMNPSPQRKQPQKVTLQPTLKNSTSSNSPLSFKVINNSYYQPHGPNFTVSESFSYTSSLYSKNSSSSPNSIFQAQDTFMNPNQNFQLIQDSNSIFMFSGEAICCSSSDGSCNNSNNVIEKEFEYGIYHKVCADNYLYSEVEDTKKFVMSNGGSVSGWKDEDNRLLRKNPLDYGQEEIKKLLISTYSCNNFLFDDKKTEERVMY